MLGNDVPVRIRTTHRFVLGLHVVVAAAFLTTGCDSANQANSAKSAKDEVGAFAGAIKIHGSSTVYPISEAVAEEFSREYPEAKITVGQSGTGGGMKKFWQGEIDICDASRPIKDSELKLCREHGIEFVELKVAFDGLAIVVHPDNDWCDCLTVDQLKAIWEPASEVNSWSDLNPAWPTERIELYGPGTDSGTFEYFTEVIVGEAMASRTGYTASEDDNVLVTGVQSDKYALGYVGYAYFEENRDRLKLLAVDAGDGNCIQPSVDSVRENAYRPLSRPLYIYVNKSSLNRPELKAFVEFYLSTAADLVADVGYVPVSDEVAAENERAFEAATAGK
jgi:phosphate transport system substrate-binding protein